MYRKLEKSTESICVRYDNSVRNCNENVVQILYGEDSINPVFVVKSDLPITSKNFWEHSSANTEKYSNNVEEKAYWLTLLRQLWLHPPAHERTTTEWLTAVDIVGLCTQIQTHANMESIPFHIIEQRIDQLCTKITISSHKQSIQFEPSLIFRIHLAFHLRLQITDHFTNTQLDTLFETIEMKYMQSLISPGEPVGGLCASACSAPATQMTLVTIPKDQNTESNLTYPTHRIQ